MAGSLHPLSGLPTGPAVDEMLTKHQECEDWSVMYVEMQGFEAFDVNDYEARKVLRFMAYLIIDTVDELGSPTDWAAHPGNNEFIIATEREYADRIRARLERRFDEEKLGFYDPMDWTRGFVEIERPGAGAWRVPIMRLNFTIIP